ncbi:hypothetical protein O181_096711 [Austropuccinia psidii MF-1]|uniref:Integrase zinc-binding domain-containing protein n=1 Tax=Austropuccinia psidii MF-1 TaxID=1389203 RepID=A0A9Q3J7Y0_9BASI|nr:hypothetical protein [Austropuccinia psidii MF-1]
MVELPSFPSFEWNFLVIDTPKGEDLILRFDFPNHFNPSIDWRQRLINFNPDHLHYSDPSKSFRNDFSSAKSCAALVGDSRTPLLPSSVNIPSINSHPSLPLSEDEFFKEIQDVGEDNFVPSLHPLFGIMDLCPSSYHDSLEELIIQRRSVNSPVSSRKIHVLPSMRKLSHKLIPAELNYEIHDKELLGIVWALKRWRACLLSLSSPFEVITDNSSLQYFISSKVLNCHQAWCADILSELHFSITYRCGRLATLLDTLSRWDDFYPERGEDFISKNPMNFQQLIKQGEVQPSRYFAVKVESFSNLIDSIQKQLWQDLQYRSILEDLGKGTSVQDYSLESSSQLLLFKDWVVVPNDSTIQFSILQKCHDSPLAGHPGPEETLKLVKRDFHWSGMTQLIKDYVSPCQQCSRNQNINHKKFGFLKPLPIPKTAAVQFL